MMEATKSDLRDLWLLDVPREFRGQIEEFFLAQKRARIDEDLHDDLDVLDSIPVVLPLVVYSTGEINSIKHTSIVLTLCNYIKIHVRFLCPSKFPVEGEEHKKGTVIERYFNQTKLDDVYDEDGDYMKVSAKWFMDLISCSEVHFDSVSMYATSRCDFPVRLCKTKKLDINLSSLKKDPELLSWWIQRFESPIQQVRISSGFQNSTNVADLPQLLTAKKLTIEGQFDIFDDFYAKMELKSFFCHEDYKLPSHITVAGLKEMFLKWFSSYEKEDLAFDARLNITPDNIREIVSFLKGVFPECSSENTGDYYHFIGKVKEFQFWFKSSAGRLKAELIHDMDVKFVLESHEKTIVETLNTFC
ncbi:unnamed protein product [Caenorhabditis angaria]|uniref:Uncharacterized protein n=1 Tax=Caenorhabditis angaria TaxID=860376 RepID=A0A9P1I4I8_9PELO|nr:unnamed protein product [Caenorhabditis angaria]